MPHERRPSFAPLPVHVPQSSELEVPARFYRRLTQNNLQARRSSVNVNGDHFDDSPRGFENDSAENKSDDYDVGCENDV